MLNKVDEGANYVVTKLDCWTAEEISVCTGGRSKAMVGGSVKERESVRKNDKGVTEDGMRSQNGRGVRVASIIVKANGV